MSRLFSALGLLILLPLAALPSARAQTIVPAGTITGTVEWTPENSPYILAGDVTVLSTATLTLKAGTVVQFAQGDSLGSGEDTARTELRVEGTLVASGVAGNRVVFQSNAASPTVGDYHGVVVLSTGTATLTQVEMRHGNACLQILGSTTSTVTGGTFTSCQRAVWIAGGSAQVSNVSILSSTVRGIYATSDAALTATGITVQGSLGYGIEASNADLTLSGSILRKNSSRGIHVTNSAGDHTVSMIHNTIVENSSYGAYILRSSGTLGLTFRDNLVVKNGSYGIYRSGTVTITNSHNLIWGHSTQNWFNVNRGSGAVEENPLLVQLTEGDLRPTSRSGARMAASDGTDIGALQYDGAITPVLAGHLFVNTVLTAAQSPHTIVGDLIVEPGVTLTIEPGAEVHVAVDSDLLEANTIDMTELRVRGTLVADGTASNGILFRAAGASPSRGDWYGIHLLPSSTSSILDFVTVRHARYGVHTEAGAGNIVQRSILEESQSYGAYVTGGNTSFSQVVVRNSGSYGMYVTASTSIDHSRIYDNSSRGIFVSISSGTHDVSITHNTIVGNSSYGIYLFRSDGTLNVTMTDNLITANGSYGIYRSGTVTITNSHNLVWGHATQDFFNVNRGVGSIDENPLLVNLESRDLRITSHSPARLHSSGGGDIGALQYDGAPTQGLRGHLYANTTWTAAGSPYNVLGDVTIEPGVTLTIQGGAQVKFAAGMDSQGAFDRARSELRVLGRLVVDGDPGKPVVFASSSGTPSKGDWYGIRFLPSAESATIEHAVINHAFYGIHTPNVSGTTSVSSTQIRNSQQYGLYVDGGNTTFDGITVSHSGSYGVYVANGAPTLSNLVVHENTSRGIFVSSSGGTNEVSMNHVTAWKNGTYGIYIIRSAGTLTTNIRNSIIAENGSYGIYRSGTVTLNLTHNNVWGHTTEDYFNVTPGPSSVSANPLFVNTELGNFHLLENSPCIDVADLATAASSDADGVTRPIDGNMSGGAEPDLGAFEYNPSANKWPIADAGPDKVAESGKVISFDASGSTDGDGTIASYQWDFGDGGSASGAMVTHTFTGGTDRTVTLTVTDNAGAIDTDTLFVKVNLAPTAEAGADKFADPGEVITFDGQGSTDSDGTLSSYLWTFGDGSQASGPVVMHQYSSGGDYTVTLTVTDNDGSTHSDTTTAHVTGGGDGAAPQIIHTPIANGQPRDVAVVVSAEITDSTGVASATLYYRATGQTTFSTLPMSVSGGNTYQATIPSGSVLPPGIDYYIAAVDSSGSANSGTHPGSAPGTFHSFTVVDTSGPVISHTPVTAPQPSGQPVAIVATVTDAVGVGSVNLYYRTQGAGSFQTVAMAAGAGNSYSGSIPGAAVAVPGVNYYISATNTGQPATSSTDPGGAPGTFHSFSVTATDMSPPTITHTPVAAGQPEGQAVTVNATITDPSTVASATLYYRVSGGAGAFASVAMSPQGSDVFSAQIPAGSVTAAGVDYYLSASDGASPANAGSDPAGAPGVFHSFAVSRAFNVNVGDIIVTEIMNNPSGDESLAEWFEVHNTTAAGIDIDGFTFSDDGTDSFTVNNGGPLVVPAGGYLVLGRSKETGGNGGVTVDYAYSGFFLSNSDDEIVIKAGALVIDRVAYDNGATFPDPDGASMILDPGSLTHVENDSGSNWCVSSSALSGGDLGTPGAANDSCAPAVDVEPPSISHSPIGDGQPSGQPVAITAQVTDDSQVGSVELFYRAEGAGAFTQTSMTNIGLNTYQAQIPAGAVNTPAVEYYLRATDASPAQNVALSPVTGPGAPYRFTVNATDTSGPQITHTPITDGQADGQAVVVRATITDSSGVASATLHYRREGGGWQTVAMSAGAGGSYEATILGASVIAPRVYYYIDALDNAPTANRSFAPVGGEASPYSFTVVVPDAQAPSIVHTPIQAPQAAASAVTITATVTDASGVGEVRLYFRGAGNASFLSAVMSSAGGGVYSADIPGALVQPPAVDYYLEATDASEAQNVARHPQGAPGNVHTFSVTDGGANDTTGPTIVHTPIANGVPAGVAVNISAQITDPSGVAAAQLYYRKVGDPSFASVAMTIGGIETYAALIPAAQITAVGVEYYIEAADNSLRANVSRSPTGAPGTVHRFTPGGGDDGGAGGGDGGTGGGGGGGGGCNTTGSNPDAPLWLLLAFGLLALRRRRAGDGANLLT